MICIKSLSTNSNYLSCDSSSGHLISFDMDTRGPVQDPGSLARRAPSGGRGEGRAAEVFGEGAAPTLILSTL